MTEKEWIKKVAPDAQAACARFPGYAYSCAVLIAQTCLETGYGSGKNCESLVAHHNILGMKEELLNDTWTSDFWPGGSFEKETPEWDKDSKKIVPKVDAFRDYPSFLSCMLDYLQFLRDARYSTGTYKYRDTLTRPEYKDPYTLISTVAGRGWCTDPGYAGKVLGIIKEHNLTKYDEEIKKMTVTSVSAWLSHYGKTLINRIGPNRNKGQLHGVNSHKYLAIHFLGVNGENPDLYDGCYGGHFYVSKAGQCYQAAEVGDRLWHVGASSGFVYLHPDARNTNTIGIECATYTASGRNNDSEPWYYTEASQISLAQLAAGILLVYGIPIENMLMHGQITTKCCPAPYKKWGGKGSNWTWGEFRDRVAAYMGEAAQPATAPETHVAEYTALRYGHTGPSVTDLQERLISLGYSCGDSGADGIFGYDTKNAVENFQADHDLTVDALAGPLTLEALRNACDAKAGAAADKTRYIVQAGAYGSKANAKKALARVLASGFEGFLADRGASAPSGARYRVQCGAYVSKKGAEGLAARLRAAGYSASIENA